MLGAALLACGPRGGGNNGGGGSTSSGGSSSSAGGPAVPAPGTNTSGDMVDTEPNDTPGQATPSGITNVFWAGFATPITKLASASDVDFYVFKTPTSPDGGASVPYAQIGMCWSSNPASNALDMFLYDVVDGHQGSQLAAATSTSTSCEILVGQDFTTGLPINPDLLKADKVYLMEIRAAAGSSIPDGGLLYSG